MKGKKEGQVYPDYIDFSPTEFKRYILHGISPSPRIEMKFQSKKKDPVNGNDFVSWKRVPKATP